MIAFLFLLFAMLNSIDAAQTVAALSTTALDLSEANPIGRLFFGTFGLVHGTILFKIIVVAAVFLAVCLLPAIYSYALLLPLIGWGLFAVIHNYRTMNAPSQ